MKVQYSRLLMLTVSVFAFSGFVATRDTAASGEKPTGAAVTFNRDIAPIFNKSCAECHRPGEAAPFSTLSFKDVRPWAKSIREKVVNRTMPPWHADPHVGEFSNDRRLSQSEIDKIVAWVNAGAPEGEAKDLPPVPKFENGWVIGKPDLVLSMPAKYTLEASGPDEYQYFTIDPGFKEDVYIQRAEARPGNRKIVHHIIAFIIPPGPERPKMSKEQMEKMRLEMEKNSIFYQDGFLRRVKMSAPVADEGCSLPTTNGREGRSSEEIGTLLCGYAPGMNQAVFEPGTVKKIPAGSKILLQMHYSKAAGSVQEDLSTIGLVMAKQPATREILTKPVSNNNFMIPAGRDNHQVTACWTLPDDIHLLTLMPHMHLRGKSQKIEAFYPNGKSEVLLNVPAYDFSWQTVYYLKTPAALPKGTRLLVTSTFDNSSKNKFNPDPTKAVRWGDPTYDEMMIGWLEFTVDKASKNTTASVSHSSGSEK